MAGASGLAAGDARAERPGFRLRLWLVQPLAYEHGAARVLGVDVSQKMFARAIADAPDPQITYRRADLETLELDRSVPFELVYSSLAFHYIQNFDRLLSEVYRSPVLGGGWCSLWSILSIPRLSIRTGEVDASGLKSWTVDSYQMEGLRVTK